MAQDKTVMSFRKRLKSYGYFDISINRDKDDFYIVKATEPLAGVAIETRLHLNELYQKFRRGIPTSR